MEKPATEQNSNVLTAATPSGNKIDDFIRVATFLDQSPLIWGALGVTLILLSFWIGKENKLGGDICLLLAGAVMTRIRSKKT